MYKLFFLMMFAFLISVYSQTAFKKQVSEKSSHSYPIAGSDLLKDEEVKTAQFLKENPDYFNQLKLKKPAAWEFNNGDHKTWLTYDYTTSTNNNPIASTCKAVGTNCYIFVADNVWGPYVDSTAVLAVLNDFDNQTPSDPNKGIFQTDVETFGNPPDVDNDPKIIILILDIQDGYTGSGGYVAGYFHSGNEVRAAGLAAEIYFMDANPVNLKTSFGIHTAVSTAAHEFQHMINWNFHKTQPEVTFINEGLSEIAQIICGYGADMQDLYASEPNHYLFDWRNNDINLVLNDYARAQRFFLYLKEQFGNEILKSIVHDYSKLGLTGLDGLNKILGQNYSTSVGKVFINFSIANGLNNLGIHSAYGYTYQPLPLTTGSILYNPNISSTAGTLQRLGAEYFTFSKSSNLNVTFSSAGNNIIVKAIAIGENSAKIMDVPLNTPFNDSEYPSVYNTIRFVAIDTNQTVSQLYNYESSGISEETVTEMSWDNTEPTGYYSWTTDDTLCVTFDAYPGGKLDSIKVALRRAGSIEGGVWEFTGRSNPTPLGKKLSGQFTASINTNAQLINPGGQYPYNIPYTNWSTVDLRSQNISTDNPFAVGFVIGSDPQTPGVMTTEFASTGAYHSYTYLRTSDDVSTPGWYYITTNNTADTIAIYLIRAYVSLVTGIVKQDIELNPTSYSLSQNFPNPFNPSTTIKFQMPKDGFVSLKVYDILGNEVRSLVNEFKSRGSYSVLFDASGLSSGIYFYKIQSNGFSEVKKLMLLK